MTKDKYLLKILMFVDRKGVVLDKSSTPVNCSLKMKYEKTIFLSK